MSVRLPAPSARYDARDEAETRRTIEQALADLAASQPDVTGPSVGGSGTIGKIPIWTGATTLGDSDIDAPNIAYLSDLFTQEMADARYSLLGHSHTTDEITDFDAAVQTLGDARYFKLTDTHLDGPLDIGDVTGLAAAMLRVGGDINASGDVGADDFVLVGGAAGGGASAALFAVSDEGTVIASSVTSMNFVGGGVSVSGAAGDVTVSITFDQAAADARYSLLGHTHAASDIVSGLLARARMPVGTSYYDTDETFSGVKEFSAGPILSNGVPLLGRRGSDNAAVALLRYDDGTSDITMILGGPIMRWRDTGAGVPMSLTSDGILTVATEVDSGDFVLVGGAGGGGASEALFSVSDEGTLLASSVSSINFVGAGIQATAVGGAVTVTSLFDQAAADARYSLLGHTHTFASLTSKPTTIGGYGITDFNSLGDARWRRLGSTVVLSGSINPYVQFSDGTYTAYWQMTAGAMSLYHNGANRFDVTAAGIIHLYSETVLSNVLRTQGNNIAVTTGIVGYDDEVFTARGASVPHYGWRWTTTTDGDLNVRLLGGAYGGISLFTGGAERLRIDGDGQITLYTNTQVNTSLTLANGVPLYGIRATGSAQVALLRYDSGTDDISTVLGGSIMRWRDTGSGVPMSLTADGSLSLAGANAAVFMKDRTSGNQFAFYATGNYGIIWSGAGIDAFKIAYGNGAATFASTATATDFILS